MRRPMGQHKESFKLVLLVVLIFSLILFSSPVFAQYFTIDRYHADITIREESSFIVRETIEVTFQRPRHGIYREIPFKYQDELGKTIVTPTKVYSVADESGKAWKYQVKQTGPLIHIRIGDAQKDVSGKQTYVITYHVENAVLFFDDHDELYWNVTGNYWKAPIHEASADVTLETQTISKGLWTACFTGVLGSKESECSSEARENRAKYFAKRRLKEGEGFTIAFGWDKGLVRPPSSWKKFLWAINIKENWLFFLPIFSFIYMANRWYRRGRDPKVRESITVMYEPPKFEDRSLTPGEVGILIDEKLDSRDITSTIVGLAVKGYIRIEETKKEGWIKDSTDYYLKKLKEPDPNLSPFEMELMNSLFPGNLPGALVSSLKNRFYTNLPFLSKVLFGELIRKKYFLSNPETVRRSYILTGFLIIVFGSIALAFLSPSSIYKAIIASVLIGIPVIGFAKAMPVKTRAGASAYMGILGFQEFMNRAEKDQLERIGDMNLFSKFLPYAIALNVVDHWAKAFEEVYQEPPEWYSSPGGFVMFSPYRFSHSIESMTSNLSTTIISTPRGSGGGGGGGLGGGGFSGGGFGGGGGGSW